MNEETVLLGEGSRLRHPAYGEGVVVRLHKIAYEICFIQYGMKTISKENKELEIIEAMPVQSTITFSDMEKSLIKVLRYWSDATEVIPLGDRWDGGTLILKPQDDSLKSKEIPIDTFFHKIVMVRDRLRVMEQRINSSKNLSDEEKVNLQQYITRIYGSLTTFNVLFKNKEDFFIGEKTR